MGSAGFSAGAADWTSLAMHPTTGAPYVAYMDGGNSQKATVRTFDGSAWSTVGSAGFSAGQATYTSLALHPTTGAPYVAYSDYANAQKVTVMTFDDGGDWMSVGNVGFSAGRADYISLALHPTTGVPYVAYIDYGTSTRPTVMTFNVSTVWSTVGTAGFSPGIGIYTSGMAQYTSLALHPTTGVPYVAYYDNSIQQIRVVTFDGSTNWNTVGSAGFSDWIAAYISLALHPTTYAPWVAYRDVANSYRATVKTFNGSAWSTVGSAGFSGGGDVTYTSLALHPTTGAPYVAYSESSAYPTYKATVRTFDGSTWSTVGSAAFSAAWVDTYTSLALHPTTGAPYVAYTSDSAYWAKVMAYRDPNLISSPQPPPPPPRPPR